MRWLQPGREKAELQRVLRALGTEPMRPGISERWLQIRHVAVPREAHGEELPTRGPRWTLWMLAGTAALAVVWGALSPAVRIRPSAELAKGRGAAGATALSASDGSPAVPTRPGIAVSRTGGLRVAGASAGPLRVFTAGVALPVDLPLQAVDARGASFQLSGRAEVRLDGAAQVRLAPLSPAADTVALLDGRIEVDVRRAARPLQISFPSSSVDVACDEGTLGALAAGGGRWSVAVSRGEARVLRAEGAITVPMGMLAGAAPGTALVSRPIDGPLPLDAHAERAGKQWVVRGLTDWLARVEADGVVVSVGPNGSFALPSASPRGLRIVALDASGAHRSVEVPDPDASPSGLPVTPASGARPGLGVSQEPRSSIDPTPTRQGPEPPIRIWMPRWDGGEQERSNMPPDAGAPPP